MRPIPFHNRTRLFTLVIKPSPVANNLPLRILYTVANNLGLSAHRAFSFGPSRRWNRSLMTGVKGNLPTVSLDTLTRRASFHLIALAALIRLFFWLTRPTNNYADHVQSS